jgi:hypothetical protein
MSPTCSAGGAASGTIAGMRSCNSSSMAWTRGSRWKRRGMTCAFRQLSSATRVMPWWCAMTVATTAARVSAGRRAPV